VARKINQLSARTVTALEQGFHADGMGLYLCVTKTGARRWSFIFRWRGKRAEMGLGPFPEISLAEARELAREAGRQVRAATNPIDERRRQRGIRGQEKFGVFADQMVDDLAPEWKSPVHIRQWRTTLTVDAASLRPLDLCDITTDDVLAVLKPIWLTKPVTAARLRGRIERVLDAAKAKGLRAGENPARWKGHLSMLLPKRQKLKKGHHPALPYDRIRLFMSRLRRELGISPRALEFTILTAARSGEVMTALGGQIDVKEAVWTVPAERMKSGRPHRVPLCPRALEIAQAQIAIYGEGHLFPGRRRQADKTSPMSSTAMKKVMRVMGYAEFTVHGFRSTFRDWAGDRTTFPRELAEAALAHVIGDEAEQAYRRSDALDRRRKLMEAWADYAEPANGGKIVAMIA
jgi:integrase